MFKVQCGTISPKARGLAQHGGPPGWLEERSDPADCEFVRDGRSMPPAMPWHLLAGPIGWYRIQGTYVPGGGY